MEEIDKTLLSKVSNFNESGEDAFNIRKNGETFTRRVNEFVQIKTKEDKSGIDIFIKESSEGVNLYIPVIITMSGLEDVVYNDFYIGKNSSVNIYAGCAIHNNGKSKSSHLGVHRFFVEKNAKVKYFENHFGEGLNNKKIMNPITEISLKDGATMEIETIQIGGVNKTKRKTMAILEKNTNLVVTERIKTSSNDKAETIFEIELNGENSSAHIISRAVAADKSFQKFESKVVGNNKCFAHVECDAIIQDKGKVQAIPEIFANHTDASLIHEATIGKIAGEQLMKLMTIGLSQKDAAKEIINGFLK